LAGGRNPTFSTPLPAAFHGFDGGNFRDGSRDLAKKVAGT
jgi:hypothetical protein